jgi:hypothetical protein
MPTMPSFGTLAPPDSPLNPPRPESPLRIAVLADFSGRENRSEIGSFEEIAARRLVRVTRDHFDEVMAKLEVQLILPVGADGEAVMLSFASLDDFHPDSIHERVDQIADAYDDYEKSVLMNSLLHHPDFQALEAAWRGLDWLLRRAVKGGQIEVVLIDLALAELAADITSSEDLSATGTYQLLIENGVRGPKGEPWAVLVGDYIFDLTIEHADLLGRLAKIASHTAAPFLATVHPRLLGKSFNMAPDAAPAWRALRQLPEAALLGLAAPRFLLRPPYGEGTQPIEKFVFQENPPPPRRAQYLWGNPALGCAALIAQAFQKQGWGCKPGQVLDLENMPVHAYEVDGEEEVTLAETWLVKPQPQLLLRLGIMPFLCVRGKGALQLLRFLSLALPPKGQEACDLIGRWGQEGMVQVPQSSRPPAMKVNMGIPGRVEALRPPPAPPPVRETATPPPTPEPSSDAATPAEDASPAAAEPEVDPELAALLQQLDTPADAAPAPAAEAPPESADPELDDLLKQLEGGA